MASSSNREHKWNRGDLQAAVDQVSSGKLSLRKASALYGIPKSTLGDYASGKREIGSTRGPPTILTAAEEKKLADWALEMSRIGYGRTKEQILLAVQQIVAADKRPTPFTGGRPGNKWWLGFLKRHETLTMRMPENLDSYRATACTKERLSKWYDDFRQFLDLHDIRDDPRKFWNADESGFSLCPKSGKVLAEKNVRDLYAVAGNGKEQITTLCAGSAAGEVIPPMHIFAGQRFAYNPLDGGVPGAYFGKSATGWIDTELFYGWLANHFARNVTIRPVVLLVDGHKSHINVEISKFCQENGIFLYCLPPHSSHITQPLDVGFFKPLKDAWKKECERYKLANPGHFVSKQSFARVFKDAWLHAAQPIILVNAFKGAGIYPLDFSHIRDSRFAPSKVYQLDTCGDNSNLSDSLHPSSVAPQPSSSTALAELESVIGPEVLDKYRTRYEEGYDLEIDAVYTVWKRLKNLQCGPPLQPSSSTSVMDDAIPPVTKPSSSVLVPEPAITITVTPSRATTVSISSAIDDILVFPKKAAQGHNKRKVSEMPRHLSGNQMIALLEAKERGKQEEEEKKAQRKAEREEKKRKTEEEREKKKNEKLKKQTGEKVPTVQGKKGKKGQKGRREAKEDSVKHIEDNDKCLTCQTDDDGTWIRCDECFGWHHKVCVGLSIGSRVGNIHWKCPNC